MIPARAAALITIDFFYGLWYNRGVPKVAALAMIGTFPTATLEIKPGVTNRVFSFYGLDDNDCLRYVPFDKRHITSLSTARFAPGFFFALFRLSFV
jgi:hypothetical protein